MKMSSESTSLQKNRIQNHIAVIFQEQCPWEYNAALLLLLLMHSWKLNSRHY